MGEHAARFRALAERVHARCAYPEADLLDTVADLLDGTLVTDLRERQTLQRMRGTDNELTAALGDAAALVEQLVGRVEVAGG